MMKRLGKKLSKSLNLANIGINFNIMKAWQRSAKTLDIRLTKDNLIYK